MPKASSSRRRIREPTPDRIEEDPSQVDRHEGVDEDEDEQPRRKTRHGKEKKATTNKGNGRARTQDNQARNDENEEVDGDEDGQDKIDVANFRDQPLAKSDATRLTGLGKDWGAIRETLRSSAFQMFNDIATVLVEVAEDDKPTQELDSIMRDIIDMDQEMNFHESIISGIAQQVALEEPINDVLEHYEKSVKIYVNDYRKKTTRQKYAKSEAYKRFQEVQFEVRNPHTPMPPITSMLEREPGDVTDDDDELEVGGATQDYRCPITMTMITDPLTSTVCGHSFSGPAIRDYLSTGKKKCPATGCNKYFSRTDLKQDRDLERRAKAAARRLEAMETNQDSDGDEVIE